jgi:hypothetical protein
VIRLDAATVLLQWAVGGMLFTWFTTRRREVGLGYGWLMRGIYLVMALGAFALGTRFTPDLVRDTAALGVVAGCALALGVSIARRSAGISGQSAEHDRRSSRVAAMTGIDRPGPQTSSGSSPDEGAGGREFPPALDLIPVVIGVVGLVAAGIDAAVDASAAVSVTRIVVGAAFLGAVTDAMLLGHWYLVQPGLPRRLLNELVIAVMWIWPLQVAVMLLPPGMIGVFTGAIDDGWGGTLGWLWAVCAGSTIVLLFVTRAALRERQYSAVMAATGLLYLAILTAFGTDLVARAVLGS